MSEKIWTPKEIKQKEVIITHIPGIRRPITTRMLRYFIPSLILSLGIFFLLSRFKEILLELTMTCLAFPFIVTILLNSPRNGQYVEDIILKKVRYKRNAEITLNEKAARARGDIK